MSASARTVNVEKKINILVVYSEIQKLGNFLYIRFTHNGGGSRLSRRGDVDLVGGRLPRRLCFKIFYVKMKESGPLGWGMGAAACVGPRSANA